MVTCTCIWLCGSSYLNDIDDSCMGPPTVKYWQWHIITVVGRLSTYMAVGVSPTLTTVARATNCCPGIQWHWRQLHGPTNCRYWQWHINTVVRRLSTYTAVWISLTLTTVAWVVAWPYQLSVLAMTHTDSYCVAFHLQGSRDLTDIDDICMDTPTVILAKTHHDICRKFTLTWE